MTGPSPHCSLLPFCHFELGKETPVRRDALSYSNPFINIRPRGDNRWAWPIDETAPGNLVITRKSHDWRHEGWITTSYCKYSTENWIISACVLRMQRSIYITPKRCTGYQVWVDPFYSSWRPPHEDRVWDHQASLPQQRLQMRKNYEGRI